MVLEATRGRGSRLQLLYKWVHGWHRIPKPGRCGFREPVMDKKIGGYMMNPFVSWGIAVAIVLGLFWLKGGKEQAKPVAIFFAGWIVEAIAMYIKATLVYKP